MPEKIKKIGLALGGGGARGCAHVGVIKALREAKIPIDCIAGTSIGALMGGVYACGNIEEFERLLLKIEWKDVVRYFDPVIPKMGFFEGKKIKKLLEKILPDPSFRKATIPYAVVVTDLLTGKEIDLKKGNVIEAIRASIAIPAIITPAKIKNRFLVDGGVVNPLPVNVARALGADIVIAVDLNHSFLNEKKYAKNRNRNKDIPLKSKISNFFTPAFPTIIDVIENSVFMMQDQLTQKNLLIDRPDYLIRPILNSAGIFDFHRAKEMIDEGYRQTKKIIKSIQKELI